MAYGLSPAQLASWEGQIEPHKTIQGPDQGAAAENPHARHAERQRIMQGIDEVHEIAPPWLGDGGVPAPIEFLTGRGIEEEPTVIKLSGLLRGRIGARSHPGRRRLVKPAEFHLRHLYPRIPCLDPLGQDTSQQPGGRLPVGIPVRVQDALEFRIKREQAPGQADDDQEPRHRQSGQRWTKTQKRRIADAHSLLDWFAPTME